MRTQNPTTQPDAGRLPLLGFALFFFVLALFLPCTRNGFINFDDPRYLLSNSNIQHGLTWETVRWAFTTGYAGNWHPLTWLSHALDWQLFGSSPWGHHLVNVLLHATSTLILYLALRRMTGAVWKSLFVAALFGMHPLRVESVAWAAERKDVLSTSFWMLTLWAYAGWVRESKQDPPARASYAVALVSFALGLLSKPMLVTLPFVLLLLDYWPLSRFSPTKITWLVVEKIPFFVLAMISCVVTYLAQIAGGAVNNDLPGMEWEARVANACVSYSRYLGELFFPVDLAVFYPWPPGWSKAEILASAALLIAFSLVAMIQVRRRPYLAVGWFWYVGTSVPIIGLVQVGTQSMADRYTYIPLIGFTISLAWGMADLTRNFRSRAALPLAAFVSLVVCAVLTFKQIGYWKDSESLFRHALAVTRSNPVAEMNLGCALLEKNRLDEAIERLRLALELSPGDADGNFNLGAALLEKQDYSSAISHFHAGLDHRPEDAAAHCSLGVAYMGMENWNDAATQFQEALRLNPNFVGAHNNLGLTLRRLGRWDEAIAQYRAALRIDSQYSDARNNLGVALGRSGKWDEAAREFQMVIKQNPSSAEAHNNLGLVRENMGQLNEAIEQYREALRLQPDYAPAQSNLEASLKIQSSRQQKQSVP